MKHRFKNICPNAGELLNNVNKLSTFLGRIEKLCKDPLWISNGWSADEYKGDALEAFVEVLINASPIDKRIGIIDYRPSSVKLDGPDMGIDGYGRSHNNTPHTVQVKYRSDFTKDLTANADSISNFVANTTTHPVYKDADMTIFTTANALNRQVSENMYHDRIRVLGYNELRKLVDDNIPFWNIFRAEMNV